jgi:biofilm protein TabA
MMTLIACGVLSGCCHTGMKQEKSTMKTPIIDKLENYKKYTALHPEFEKAFTFLRQENLAQLELTKHVLDGDKLFCPLSKSQGRKREDASLEAHRRYIDIQYVISGIEEMGYKPVAECRQEKEAYNPEKDIIFFKDLLDQWIKVPAGSFIIFFPQDAHAPLIGNGEIHKAVVKVELKESNL